MGDTWKVIMKNLPLFLAVLSCAVSYLLGFSSGLGLRLSIQSSSSRGLPVSSDLKCTCVPCLPDHYCRKCGHVSRDCPKLRWYFHPTNAVNRAAFSTNQTSRNLAN